MESSHKQKGLAKARETHLYGSIPLFKMDKSVVFQFLHSFQLSKLGKGLFKKLLSHCCCQLPHKEHLYL